MGDPSPSPTKTSTKTFKYLSKRPKTGLQSIISVQEPIERTQSEYTPRYETQNPLRISTSQSTSANKTPATRPSTGIQTVKTARPKSVAGYKGLKIDILMSPGSPRSAAQSPKSGFASPRSPLSANLKLKLNITENNNGNASPFPVFSAKSPRSTYNTLLSFYENTSEAHLKLIQKSEDIIQDAIQKKPKSIKSFQIHRRTSSLNEKKSTTEQIKFKTMDECLLPGKDGPGQNIPTVKHFLDNVKGNMDYCKRRDVQDLLQHTSNHQNIKEHLLKLGLASPRSFREKAMFDSFGKNIDSYLFNNTQKLRDDILSKKWSICANPAQTRQGMGKEPLIFSPNFNMRKYCKKRGMNSITEALRFHNEKAWNVALKEPNKIQTYLEGGNVGDEEVLSQNSSNSD